MDLPFRYNPNEVEPKILARWEKKGWVCNPRSGRKPFSIVIPPPNITGRLHMGHALNNTLQDVVIRFKRMNGYEACWFPGTDHAGIATQAVVEMELLKEGKTRKELGREAFLARVWQWKEKYGNEIVEQLKALGCSCDWSRLRFTLDPGLSRAVRTAFVRLYHEGLIYRGEYMINWCPRCETALSDLEVEHEEVQGNLYFVRYPLEEGGYVTVATTRPETMLGDTALAVNPHDERYRHLIGKIAVLPVLSRRLPIVAAEEVDPEFGTGVLKVTPAHDPVDFQIGQRLGLPAVNVLNGDGTINENGGPFAGLDRFKAREALVERLRAEGLLEKIVPYKHAVGHCQRCRTMVEPRISTQWFVRTKPLAEPAIRVVQEGKIRFIPERWTKVYFDWLENIRDWCISRQLWWGHRIPAWYGPDGEIIVAMDEEEAKKLARERYGEDVELHQDEDVLDTWFSSALWPFSVMGWPETTEDLKTFYPTDLLITGFDILFFWVARMVMMGLHFLGEVPFREVLITPLIVDERGQKMSKTRGNVIDPLELIQSHGADALRFTMVHISGKGRSARFSRTLLDESRDFLNKIWNMARFILTNTEDLPAEASLANQRLAWEDRWILSRLQAVIAEVRNQLERYAFHLAAETLYHFVWDELCDWYLELSKVRLYGEDAEARRTAQVVLRKVLLDVVHLLHPFLPFITEEIGSFLGLEISRGAFPKPEEDLRDPEAEEVLSAFQELVREVRAMRAELGLDPARELDLVVTGGNRASVLIGELGPGLARLARVRPRWEPGAKGGEKAARGLARDITFFLELPLEVDWSTLRARLERSLRKVEEELAKVEARLASPDFKNKAPEEVLAKTEAQVQELRARRA
ncbi:valine--tRNA ligase, partial [Candidatus Bipolaricaulota bacterium]|nr:valine--tRNA ligase [Candidatus Bipolaricaulota bacterium]